MPNRRNGHIEGSEHTAPPPPPRPPLAGEGEPPRGPISKKRAAFKRVAQPCLANAIQALQYLSDCADPQRYEILPGDVAYIEEKLMASVIDVIERYKAGRRKPVISLPD